MVIQCATVRAAGQVLTVLLQAKLWPIRQFTISPVFSLDPPITFTTSEELPAPILCKIRSIADTTIT